MFRSDCDPHIFEQYSFEDPLNNNIGLVEHIKDLDFMYSDDYLPAPTEIEMFSHLPKFDSEEMELKEEMVSTTSPVPSPAPLSPQPQSIPEVKCEEPSFDLIKYIIFGEVSNCDDDNDEYEIVHLIRKLIDIGIYTNSQNAELLATPVEEKPCPSFDVDVKPVIKIEPEPSTSSTASSPKRIHADDDDTNEFTSLRPRTKKRRYSSDSDFSIGTSASSYNATSKRVTKKKRGRPAKELITDLPTVDDFKGMPLERASHLVLRIKNNEASRKSRMKSKSQQDKMEEKRQRLEKRRRILLVRKNKLDRQIEKLRQWLLGAK